MQVHGNILNNIMARAKGHVDRQAVAARVTRALVVLRTYDIHTLGAKVNGWGESVVAYRVGKPGQTAHEVQVRPALDDEGSCSCKDWIMRRSQHGGNCKHVIAVKALRAAAR